VTVLDYITTEKYWTSSEKHGVKAEISSDTSSSHQKLLGRRLHRAGKNLANTFGAGPVTLKSIICLYCPSLCNSITLQSIVLESCSNS